MSKVGFAFEGTLADGEVVKFGGEVDVVDAFDGVSREVSRRLEEMGFEGRPIQSRWDYDAVGIYYKIIDFGNGERVGFGYVDMWTVKEFV